MGSRALARWDGDCRVNMLSVGGVRQPSQRICACHPDAGIVVGMIQPRDGPTPAQTPARTIRRSGRLTELPMPEGALRITHFVNRHGVGRGAGRAWPGACVARRAGVQAGLG